VSNLFPRTHPHFLFFFFFLLIPYSSFIKVTLWRKAGRAGLAQVISETAGRNVGDGGALLLNFTTSLELACGDEVPRDET